MQTLLRPSTARIHRWDDWKTSAYAFVPYQTCFGELCGFADDVVAPGRGFGMHPHQDMEINTVMLVGAQRHRDSTGSTILIDAHDVQTMSAGTGILHSEVNASSTEPFHSYQIWVYPKHRGVAPRHEAFRPRADAARNRFVLALSPDRREGSALIGQDAFLSRAVFDAGKGGRYPLHGAGQGVYVHCARGEVTVAGHRLAAGDAIGVWETEACTVEAIAAAELVLVEVPMTRGVRV
jgi:redox-sensitive bicupin YhaK (pirin superfamily)